MRQPPIGHLYPGPDPVLANHSSWAHQVSGTLTRTYVIVEDTDLVGDVTCDVGSNPCFSFGASGVELRLNSFTISGKADPVTGCGGADSPMSSASRPTANIPSA